MPELLTFEVDLRGAFEILDFGVAAELFPRSQRHGVKPPEFGLVYLSYKLLYLRMGPRGEVDPEWLKFVYVFWILGVPELQLFLKLKSGIPVLE